MGRAARWATQTKLLEERCFSQFVSVEGNLCQKSLSGDEVTLIRLGVSLCVQEAPETLKFEVCVLHAVLR